MYNALMPQMPQNGPTQLQGPTFGYGRNRMSTQQVPNASFGGATAAPQPGGSGNSPMGRQAMIERLRRIYAQQGQQQAPQQQGGQMTNQPVGQPVPLQMPQQFMQGQMQQGASAYQLPNLLGFSGQRFSPMRYSSYAR